MTNDSCSKCGQSFKIGELVVNQTWNGDGGEHANCPPQCIVIGTQGDPIAMLAELEEHVLASIERESFYVGPDSEFRGR